MDKIYGAKERQDGLYKIGRAKWELIYGFGQDDSDSETGYNYRQRFNGSKPSLDDVKTVVINQINANTDANILSGFVWNDMPVWLSTENQLNYKAAYDMAVQTQGASLPAKFKFGTDDNPVYHTFESLDVFEDFFTSMLKHVSDAIDAGWVEKDGIDWSVFET